MGTRYYVERAVAFDDQDWWPEILERTQWWNEAVEFAVGIALKDEDATSILIGDEDGPHEIVARVEDITVAEHPEAAQRGARAVLTIDEPDKVPRELVAAAATDPMTRLQISTHYDDFSIPLYVQLREGALDDTSLRFRMMELNGKQRKLPAVGTIVARTEAPTVRYRVTSIHGRGAQAYARLLPFRSSGREVVVTLIGGTLAGDGSAWVPAGERANPEIYQEDVDAAVSKYAEFHRFDPKKLEEIADLKIPTKVKKLGAARDVLYRSAKVDPATLRKPKRAVDYVHEFAAGVVAYAADGSGDSEVPPSFAKVTAVVFLGKCLGFALRDGTEAEGVAPLPDLCCTPDGKCLFVIQDKKKVLHLFWGGALGVFARGIDG